MSNKVPWEPYKAACDGPNKNYNHDYTSFNSLNLNNTQLTESINTNALVKYKIDTDLTLFNAKRPGSQFTDSDLQILNSNKIEANNKSNHQDCCNNLKEEFIDFKDARFYTDFYFLKMANELKTKCTDNNSDDKIKTKPINVVNPLSDKSFKTNESPAAQSPTTSNIRTTTTTTTATNRYEARIEYLEDQIKGFFEQLQIQTQVNAELKKLLIASIGDSDTAYKIERLINDKQRFEYELAKITNELVKTQESVEQVSIRCDMWRSKFLACKLMSEEASTWKSFLLLLNNQNEKVLSNLLNDNELINDKLNQALDLLSDLKDQESKSKIKKAYNNLQASTLLLCGLNSLYKSNTTTNRSFSPQINRPKTNNELISAQMLEQYNWVNLAIHSNNNHSATTDQADTSGVAIDSFDKLEKLFDKIKLSRTTIHSRLYQSTENNLIDSKQLLNFCTSCKGQIKII